MSKLDVRILGSGREVGRAAIAVGSNGSYLLLDYGVNFNERDEPQLPLHVRPSEVAGVVVTHAHLDHIGAVPFLYTTARLPAVMTPLTKQLSEVMIKDFLKISGYYLPFEEEDLRSMIENTIVADLGEEVRVGEFLVKLVNAGHIPGSSMVYVEVDDCRVMYTGDVNTIDTRLVKGADPVGMEADILIIEGTYGNAVHPSRAEVEREFVESVKEVLEGGGNVLIPAFSLGRSQEILALLYEKMPWAHVFYDGMVRVINNVMLSSPEYINRYDLLAKAVSTFRMVRSTSERRRLVRGEENVIVSSAGMLKGGPAAYYLKKLMGDPSNAVFMVSYQASLTPGRELLENGTAGGLKDLVKARVQWFDFSSHAGADGLLSLVRKVKGVSKVIIVHSEEESGLALKKGISEVMSEDDIYFPLNGDVIHVEV